MAEVGQSEGRLLEQEAPMGMEVRAVSEAPMGMEVAGPRLEAPRMGSET
jgi:hypothetical protein